jgi:hypothetical protein
MESAAAAVGAGILLGSFAAGLAGLLMAWPRRIAEKRVFRFGYIGGTVGAVLMIADITLRYGV